MHELGPLIKRETQPDIQESYEEVGYGMFG